MNKKLRIFSFCLALVMLFSILPAAAGAERADTIALGDTKDVVIDEAHKTVSFYFTPAKTGYYVFWSDDNTIDTYADLLNSDGDKIAHNDDGGDGNNFRLEVSLDAGVQYEFVARAYSDSSYGTMKVHLGTLVEPTKMEILKGKDAVTVNVGAELWCEAAFYPANSYSEPYTVTSSNPKVVATNSGSDSVYAVGAGTATITAISESGLKDSVKVTVAKPISIKVGQKDEVSCFNPVPNTYKFVAPANGAYTVFAEGSSNRDIYVDFTIFSADGEYLNSGRGFRNMAYASFDAQKGQTYYFSFYHAFGSTNFYTVSVEKNVKNEGIQFESPAVSISVGDWMYLDIAPKPINSYYEGDLYDLVLSSSDPSIAYIPEDSWEIRGDDVGTVTVTASDENGAVGTCKVNVQGPKPITKLGKQKFNVDGRSSYLFSFTPTTGGKYHLYSTDTAVDVYIDTDPIDENVYQLEAGVTYTICVYYYGLNQQGEFVLCKDGAYSCHKKGHQMVTIRGFASTTLTPGVAETACKICGLSGVKYGLKVTAKKDAAKQFNDIKKKNWFYESVNFVYNNNFFNGTATNVFSPEETLTRGMFVTILGRMSGVAADKTVTTKFTDVAKGQYYTSYVKWANDAGIVNGVSATTFEPEANITREQICTMMVRYIEYNGICLRNDTPAVKFKDQSKISSWAKKAVEGCQRGGIVNGIKDGNGYVFNPQGNATRAEAATIVYNFTKNYTAVLLNGSIMLGGGA